MKRTVSYKIVNTFFILFHSSQVFTPRPIFTYKIRRRKNLFFKVKKSYGRLFSEESSELAHSLPFCELETDNRGDIAPREAANSPLVPSTAHWAILHSVLLAGSVAQIPSTSRFVCAHWPLQAVSSIVTHCPGMWFLALKFHSKILSTEGTQTAKSWETEKFSLQFSIKEYQEEGFHQMNRGHACGQQAEKCLFSYPISTRVT